MVIPIYILFMVTVGTSDGEDSAAMQETQVWSLDSENPLEKEIATHTEEPGKLQFMGSQRVRHNWAANTFTFMVTLTVQQFKQL